MARLPAAARPVGIMPSPPEVGGAVMSFVGGPIAVAFGSVCGVDDRWYKICVCICVFVFSAGSM